MRRRYSFVLGSLPGFQFLKRFQSLLSFVRFIQPRIRKSQLIASLEMVGGLSEDGLKQRQCCFEFFLREVGVTQVIEGFDMVGLECQDFLEPGASLQSVASFQLKNSTIQESVQVLCI